LRVHAEIRGAIAIDEHAQFGLVQAQRGVRVDDPAVRARFLAQLLRIVGERREVRTEQAEVDLERTAAERERLGVAQREPDVLELRQAAAQIVHHVALRVVALERLPRFEARERREETR
jgi:hypothetical protein